MDLNSEDSVIKVGLNSDKKFKVNINIDKTGEDGVVRVSNENEVRSSTVELTPHEEHAKELEQKHQQTHQNE